MTRIIFGMQTIDYPGIRSKGTQCCLWCMTRVIIYSEYLIIIIFQTIY